MRMVGSADGMIYGNSNQLMANLVGWAVEDRSLLGIRARGHFNRTLEPMEADQQRVWEYEDDMWTSADGSALDQGKVETFVGRFTGLSVTGVSEAELPESATMAFVLTDDEGDQTLTMFALEDGEKYVAVSDRVAGAYVLSKYIAEQMNKPLADILPGPPEDEESETEAEPEAEAEPETEVEPELSEEAVEQTEEPEFAESSEEG